VALELPYAGVWTHYNQKMNNFLEEGDIDEALRHMQLVMMSGQKNSRTLFQNLYTRNFGAT
jgi:predicted metalloprotease